MKKLIKMDFAVLRFWHIKGKIEIDLLYITAFYQGFKLYLKQKMTYLDQIVATIETVEAKGLNPLHFTMMEY